MGKKQKEKEDEKINKNKEKLRRSLRSELEMAFQTLSKERGSVLFALLS